ncbi:family 43 glycosylhydrolase [Catenuloplanes japonicus]|uniref:family 43 glycosylhydrolase n=1 Tax=Catenuloplanes japonicus TaxID=33876 RepID=UPI000A10BB82|nr:family 43 glycosylhydrolase [Catenuloplanes japonicus]
MKLRVVPPLLLLIVSFLTLPSPAQAAPASYTNPVSAGTVDTFPDPALLKAKDGLWYAYGTTNPIRNSAGETGEHILPIMSSPDLVHWTLRGEVYPVDAKPSWWPAATRAWAPDIRYVDGTYRLTYSLSVGGIALLTGPTPLGPWTDHGLIVPAANSGCPTGSIDQALFTDVDGAHYLYWGSYDVICVSRTTADATALTGPVTQVARGRRAEGGYVVHRDGWYYLLYSDAGCCDGAFSGYTVKAGRATSPLGPFTTPLGDDLMDLRSHDGIVLTATGNGWIGPGHHSIATDVSGQDWIVYHAIPAADPDFPAITGANGATLRLTKRPLMIDRLDWADGWPVVDGPSADARPAPVTTWTVGTTFASGAGFSTAWSRATDPDSGRYAVAKRASFELSDRSVSGDVRVEGDLRGGAGLVVSYRDPANHVVAWLSRDRLTVTSTVAGRAASASAALPAGFRHDTWHTVAASRRGRSLTVEMTADRQGAPLATVTLPVSQTAGRIGAAASSAGSAADNLGAAPLHRPVTTRVPDPVPGPLLPAFSDEFDDEPGDEFGDGSDPAVNTTVNTTAGTTEGTVRASETAWSWVRGESAQAVRTGGALVWPTQNAELWNSTNTASVLLRDAPALTDFTVETKLTFDGTRGNQRAGVLLYGTDDRYFTLAHSVLPLNNSAEILHEVEFAKEGPRPTYSLPTPVANAPMFGGPAAPVTWLRLRYHHDAATGEDEVRAASSIDGRTWTWGGVWTLPHDGPLRIGLVSMNASGATAAFDYVRTYAG